MRPATTTPLDDDAFRLLAIPFGGPIVKAGAPQGVDLHSEWFSRRTDIRPDWMRSRPVDWQHQRDPKLRRSVLGKAVDLTLEQDGWWVTVVLDRDRKAVGLVRALAAREVRIYGSSQTIPELKRATPTGELLSWPYYRQALTATPINALSVIRPMGS